MTVPSEPCPSRKIFFHEGAEVDVRARLASPGTTKILAEESQSLAEHPVVVAAQGVRGYASRQAHAPIWVVDVHRRIRVREHEDCPRRRQPVSRLHSTVDIPLEVVHVPVPPVGNPTGEQIPAIEGGRRRHPAGDEAQRVRPLAKGLLETGLPGITHLRLTVEDVPLKLNSLREVPMTLADDSPAITLTPAAAAHVRRAMANEGLQGHGLRISVVTGGCSGNEYAINFAATPQDGDAVYEFDDLKVFVDVASRDKLAGTVLDYVDDLSGGGLRFRNPNATHQCGCGTSFATE